MMEFDRASSGNPWTESPVEENERSLRQRKRQIRGRIRRMISWWFLGHVAAFMLMFIGFGLARSEPSFLLPVLILSSYAFSFAGALTAFIITLSNWSLLTWWWRFEGIIPWMVILAEFTLALLVTLA